MSLTPIEPRNEAAVTLLLEQTRTSLVEAMKRSDVVQISTIKAQAATVAEATKQLGLSKEIQLDAGEMVRRSEFWLGKAVRQGQEDGEIETLADARSRAGRISHGQHPDNNAVSKLPLNSFVTRDEMVGNGAGISHLADGVDPDRFEEALADAKAEGNVSRANVVRKIKNQAGPTTRDQRADLIEDLAAQGYSSRQMPAKVGVTEETVRQIARDYGIEIPADKAVGRARRHDSHRIATETVATLEGLAIGVDLINYDDIDPRDARQWADSLTNSLRALNRFAKQIKETTHA